MYSNFFPFFKLLDAIAKQHGCLPPPLLENQRPMGVDRLEQIFRANSESRLMELFLFHFHQTGYTLKQVFLLTPAYGTVDPTNLEAILSTKFEGFAHQGPPPVDEVVLMSTARLELRASACHHLSNVWRWYIYPGR